jgi:hypothetical protein
MTNLDELFASAKRNGIGVLVINDLHIGDRVTAETLVGGDVNTTTTTTNTLSIPREMLQAPRSDGRTLACTPLDPYVAGFYAGNHQHADDSYFAKISNGSLWGS